MQNLILFFVRNNALFLFILLEMIGLSLLVNNNSTHNKTFLSAANNVSGTVFEKWNNITRYWNLSTVNDSLARENAELRSQMRNSFINNTVSAKTVNDEVLERQYEYVEAVVISNSTGSMNNYLIINRGTRHGIQPNMAVINAAGNGLVGIVRHVGTNYSTVMSILHSQSHISARIKRNRFFGSLVWDGRDSRSVFLEAVPKHATIIKNDTIVTSGFSSIFPPGIMIGNVRDFDVEPGSNDYSIKVELSGDLNNIEYVYVIRNLMKKEREELEELINE